MDVYYQPLSKYHYAKNIGFLAQENDDPNLCARVFSDCSLTYEKIMLYLENPKDFCKVLNEIASVQSNSYANDYLSYVT